MKSQCFVKVRVYKRFFMNDFTILFMLAQHEQKDKNEAMQCILSIYTMKNAHSMLKYN